MGARPMQQSTSCQEKDVLPQHKHLPFITDQPARYKLEMPLLDHVPRGTQPILAAALVCSMRFSSCSTQSCCDVV